MYKKLDAKWVTDMTEQRKRKGGKIHNTTNLTLSALLFIFMFKLLLLPVPCWWWKRVARCWRTTPGGPPGSDWPSAPSSRPCGPGDAHCSLTAVDSKGQQFIVEFQFKYWPFLPTYAFWKTPHSLFFVWSVRLRNKSCFPMLGQEFIWWVIDFKGFILKRNWYEITIIHPDVWLCSLTTGATSMTQLLFNEYIRE